MHSNALIPMHDYGQGMQVANFWFGGFVVMM